MRLIDADALIQHTYSAVVDGVETDIIDVSNVDNAPTVEERTQGEWINTSPYDIEGECSKCCYLSNKCYNFCPNCGAMMKRR